MMAALKLTVPIIQINCHHQQRFDLSCSGSNNLLNLKVQNKRECGFELWAQSQWTSTTTTKSVEEEKNRSKPAVSKVEEIQITHDRGFHKDMNFLPRPLSALTCPSSLDGRNVRIAYRGAPGSFSEDAALKKYPNCETVPCDKFETALKAVELWLVDKAILPMENSVGGSIHRNYDLLLCHRLHIVGEVQLAVNHCLLGLHGVKKDELKFVLSHPQALDQCDTTLNKLGVSRVSVEDTAGAAQLVAAESMRETGAIASARAGKIYGLNIIEERIQDDLNNVTRFLILAREPIIPRTDRPYKTSIVFSLLEEGPGVLFKALGAFALRGIELSKIESRPQRNRPMRIVDDCENGSAKYFEYLLFVDFEASMADHRAQCALGHLQEYATYLRVLGCYPMDITAL